MSSRDLVSTVLRAPYERLEERCLLAADAVSAPDITSSESISPHDNLDAFDNGVRFVHDQYGLDGLGQTVAIIDSGIAYDHAALGGGFGSSYRVVGGFDFTGDTDTDPMDNGPAGSHGTHVAGIVGSQDAVHRGVAPGVDFVGLRIFDDYGRSEVEWMEDALQWVYEKRNTFDSPITTVNLSVGIDLGMAEGTWDQIDDELQALHDVGIFVSSAAGNLFSESRPDALMYPAASKYVVPVASIDKTGQISDFSQRNDRVLAAPGENIISTSVDYLSDFNGITDDFAARTGTSMAAPFIAGASVLVRQAMQQVGIDDINQDVITEHLRATADSILDSVTGNRLHRINLPRAIEQVFASVATSNVDVPATITGPDKTIDSVDNEGSLIVPGGDGNDAFVVDVRNGVLQRDGETIAELVGIHSVTITGGGGRDTVKLIGTDQDEVAAVRTDGFEFVSDSISINVDGFEKVSLDAGGGSDSMQITDSAASETIIVRGVEVQISAASSQIDVRSFERVAIASEEGGSDSARIWGTRGNDRIVLNSTSATFQSDLINLQLAGIERVMVYAAGGSDSATLTGDSGRDVFFSSPDETRLSGESHEFVLKGVEFVTATSGGGSDSAHLEDSSGNDQLLVTPEHAVMQGRGYRLEARGFSNVTGSASEGHDTAQIVGTEYHDYAVMNPGSTRVHGHQFYAAANHFDKVRVDSGGSGVDQVFLFDSRGDDHFLATPDMTRMSGETFENIAEGFASVRGYAMEGGRDSATLVDSLHDDVFISHPEQAVVVGQEFWNSARGFEEVVFRAGPGNDQAMFYGLSNDDRLTGRGRRATMRNRNTTVTLIGVDEIGAKAIPGHTPSISVSNADFAFQDE